MTSKHTRILSAAAALSAIMVLGGVSLAAAANAPTVTAISPSSGTTAGGDTVTITGTGFTGAMAVDFGTTPASVFTVASDTSITATSPAGTPGANDVTVVTSNGTSTTGASDRFTYVSPATTDAATGITSSDATLNGTNGTAAATGSSFWISTSTFSTAAPILPAGVYSTPDLGAVAPNASFSSAASAATGIGTIQPATTYYYAAWTESGGTWQPGAVMSFTTSATTTASAPTVSAILPTSGTTAGGTSIAITGTGFTGATAVKFGTTSAPHFTINGDTSITATSPAGAAGADDVRVVTPNGTSATSSADRFTYTAPVLTPPVISNVAVNATTTGATITWNTDADSSSQVFYGTSSNYGSASTLNPTATTTHSVTISGLQQATLYHFNVASTDAGGTATSSDMVFDTGSTASTTPLAVTGIDSTKTTATADGTFADGWQWVLHFVVPSNENYFSMKFADFTSSGSSSTIPAANNIEFWSPESSNASSSASALVETNNNYTGVMNLAGDTSTTTPGRQIDVYIGVAVPSGTPTGTYSTTFGAMSTTSATTTP